MINSIEDLKDRYGYRKADCCGNCLYGYDSNPLKWKCYFNKQDNKDAQPIEVFRESYCSAFKRTV